MEGVRKYSGVQTPDTYSHSKGEKLEGLQLLMYYSSRKENDTQSDPEVIHQSCHCHLRVRKHVCQLSFKWYNGLWTLAGMQTPLLPQGCSHPQSCHPSRAEGQWIKPRRIFSALRANEIFLAKLWTCLGPNTFPSLWFLPVEMRVIHCCVWDYVIIRFHSFTAGEDEPHDASWWAIPLVSIIYDLDDILMTMDL